MDSINNQQSTINNRVIYPVILAVPEKGRLKYQPKKAASL